MKNWCLILSCVGLLFLPTMAQATDSYRLKSGDTLDIRVIGKPELNTVQALTPDGTVCMPLIGRMSLQGKTLYEVDNLLKSGLAKYLNNPHVLVILKPDEKATPEALYYVTIHNVRDNTWQTKTMKTNQEALAWTAGKPYTLIPPSTFLITMGTPHDFWEDNWPKFVSAASIITGIFLSLHR